MTAALISVTAGPGGFGSSMIASGDSTGAVDDAAQALAYNLVASGARTLAGVSDPLGTGVIKYGPGTYYFTQPIMNTATPTGKVRGLRFEGAGTDITTFVFTPAAATAMCINQKWQNVQFKGITFKCNTTGSDFMQSQELAGISNIQYFNYEDCGWSGFQNVFIVTGGNNNSEWTWDRCNFGTCTGNVLYIPSTATATINLSNPNILIGNSPEITTLGSTVTFGGTLGNITSGVSYYVIASTTTSIQIATTAGGAALVPSVGGSLSINTASDQFLNFSFHNTKYNPSSSNAPFLNMGKGGSITFSGYFDVSGWSPTVDTYLINLLGTAHAQGVLSFTLEHLRVEAQSDHALLFHCQWPGGLVKWSNVDTSSQIAARTNTAIQYVLIELLNVGGPNIIWDNCNFLGTHMYTYGSNNFQSQSSINYRSCEVLQQANAASFALFTKLAANSGGAPRVSFDIKCRGNDASEIFPTDLNWQLSTSGVTTAKTVNFVGTNSDGPTAGGNIQRKLPMNAVLKSWTWNKVGNANSGAFSFSAQTIEGTPTVLSTFSGAAAGAAANPASTALNFWMTSDAQRTLQVVDTQAGGRANPFTGYVAVVTYEG